MKKIYIIFTLSMFALTHSMAQTVSNFENIVLSPDSFWDGRYNVSAGGFTSGNAFFTNHYDTAFQYWSEGFMLSNKTDSSTSSSANAYSKLAVSAAGRGYNSQNYAVGTQLALMRLMAPAAGKQVQGFYVTNSNYTWLSMRYGDNFAKKFGGTSGNDPDYFKLTVFGFYNNNPAQDTVEFYLADYRFSNNTQDYILSNWAWVDLTPMGNIDSLQFVLSSTDNDSLYGMNTPAYFCMDDFTTRDIATGIQDAPLESQFSLYPNPAADIVYIASTRLAANSIIVADLCGRVLVTEKIVNGMVDLSTLNSGVYVMQIETEQGTVLKKLIKK